ncbi:hypothetical protein MMC29_001679 [Sticta canariensis]|nr:hypothetical protein [Sticta canariensis]
MTDNMIEVGKTWDSVADGKMAVEQWAVANGLSYQVLKSNKKQWVAGCKDVECTFGIRITFSTRLRIAALTIYVPHTCPAATHYGWSSGGRAIIRWSDEDTKQIVDWLSERDEQGVLRNLDEWSKGRRDSAVQRMLKATGLIRKAGVNKAKALSKIIEMIRGFKRMRTEAKNAGWGRNPVDHKLPLSKEDCGSVSIGEHILSKCWWYYDFDVLFGDNLSVTSPDLIESGTSDREAGLERPMDVGSGEGASGHEGAEPEGFDVKSWHEGDRGEDRQGSEDEVEDRQELELDNDFATECLNEALAKISSQQTSVTNRSEKMAGSLPSRRAQRSTRDLTTRPTGSRTPQAFSSWRETRALTQMKMTPKRRRSTYNDDSQSEREGDDCASHAVGNKKRRGPGSQNFLTGGEAAVDVEQTQDAGRSRAEELEERRFEAEMSQKDQHYQLLMGKQEETNLRLRLELEKLKNNPRWST